MSIFNFWKRDTGEQPASQAQTPPVTPNVDDILLKALLAGEPITREQAMTIPAVSESVDFIANSIAAMPIKLYKKKKGSIESADDDPRVKFLNDDTGDTLDAFQMKKNAVIDFLMDGNSYIYIRKYYNNVTGLFYVAPEYVAPLMISPNPIYKRWKLYVYENEYELFEFVKLLRNTQNGADGVGLTDEVAKALETAYKTIVYQLNSVSNGGNKKGFLKSQRKLAQDEIDVLKRAWANLYKNNSENVVVLNNGLDFQEASNSSVEMQLNQSKQTLTSEIKGIFHIYDKDYYRTFKEAIYPIIRAFETALNRDLLLESEKKKYFFEFDVKEILRVNIDERYKAYKLAKETGFMTTNEIREAENLPRIDGMDVINVGLASVLYDTNSHKYYTPNTDALTDPADGSHPNQPKKDKAAVDAVKKEDEKLIQKDIAHEEYTQEEEDGNVE